MFGAEPGAALWLEQERLLEQGLRFVESAGLCQLVATPPERLTKVGAEAGKAGMWRIPKRSLTGERKIGASERSPLPTRLSVLRDDGLTTSSR